VWCNPGQHGSARGTPCLLIPPRAQAQRTRAGAGAGSAAALAAESVRNAAALENGLILIMTLPVVVKLLVRARRSAGRLEGRAV
jgi:hypothetical protein